MRRPREGLIFAGCLALQSVLGCAVTVAARGGAAPSTVTWLLALSFVPYATPLILAGRGMDIRWAGRAALWGSALLGAVFLLAPPVLSDDLYRYLWEGRVWLEGLDPYRLAPNDAALSHLRDSEWASINNKALASIYPPLSQLLFVASAWLGGGVWTVKLLACSAHVLSTAVVAAKSPYGVQAWAIGLNPLLLAESAISGHFDILVGASLLVVGWSLRENRFVRAAVAVCVAVGLKVVGVILWPLLWPRRSVWFAAGVVSAMCIAPLVFSQSLTDPGSGPGQYAQRWRGNESLFAIVDWTVRQLIDEVTRADLVARLVVVIALILVLAVVVHARVPPLRASRILLWSVLLLSPQVHPWYLAWLLPLDVAAGGRAGLVWSAAVLVAYAPLDRWVSEGVWEIPVGLWVLEYLAVLVALSLDARRAPDT